MTKVLNTGISLLIFFTLLLTAVMPPAPREFFNLNILILVSLIVISIIIILSQKIKTSINFSDYNFLLRYALLLYLLYLLISFYIGLVSLKTPLSALRSTGPYVILLPFLVLICLRDYKLNLDTIAGMLIFCGLLQALNCIYLYFTGIHNFTVANVLVQRITFLDPRTTLPFVLASAILPLNYFFNSSYSFYKRYVALLIIALSVFGAIATSTRSIILAIGCGWFIYLMTLLIYREKLFKLTRTMLLRRLGMFAVLLILLFFLFNHVQATRAAFLAFSARAGVHNFADYSTGRIDAEWLPAIRIWWHAKLLNFLFGAGAGIGFDAPWGKSVTYMHNLLVYALFYGGIFGVVAVLSVYFATFYSLWEKAKILVESQYFMFCAFLFGLFCYAELFAVHKLFSYNLIFALLIGIALRDNNNKILS